MLHAKLFDRFSVARQKLKLKFKLAERYEPVRQAPGKMPAR
ncbi:MAG: hypothetical protein AVDCRST_MAG78-3361 [uncultured Rubrobacteraceae bacterium]|uniref:Uncharacterized protein n=1 Tax=uncultured Rubrobacteraceae bacterium TaxID=349277 RepID=A0A6J4QQV0_9ACTN|nr:MAG: hypothetical protein AVDCRST_MAG78-3361 [uncultured Rubrobacteraceae bacterium]